MIKITFVTDSEQWVVIVVRIASSVVSLLVETAASAVASSK